jgi:Ribonuclease G/E
MTTRMLIDARHREETRVAVVTGNQIEEFDFESAEHKQLKGNIYLAKVTRVEPSLQAAFVDYGGNRHGFLAFAEIHPDYYQIPREDRERLLAEEAEAAAEEAALREQEEDDYDEPSDIMQGSAEREDDVTDLIEVDSDDSVDTIDMSEGEEPDLDGNGDENGGDDASDENGRGDNGRNNRRRRGRGGRSGGDGCCGHYPASPLQDTGRHPPPSGAAGSGRQGRTRQQGRGADHLSESRGPLLRLDAQHLAWRWHQPENPQRSGPQAAEDDYFRPDPAVDHGLHHPHRRPCAHKARNQARLRLSCPAVGRHTREYPEGCGADADPYRQRPYQARDPRYL